MKINRKTIFILFVIILSAFMLQIYKFGLFENLFSVKQTFSDGEIAYLNTDIPEKYKKILVIYGDEEEGSVDLYNNINHTFDMAKMNYEMINVKSNEIENKITELDNEDLVIIATEEIFQLNNEKSLIDFVKNGGNVVFLVRFLDGRFDEIIGITENRGFYDKDLYGFSFEKPIFPGLDEINLKDKKIPHSSIDMTLNDKVDILATAENIPIIWTHKFGEGEILYINSTMFMDKTNRGLMLQYISWLDDYFISTIFNSKIVNIDDFPAPIKRGKDEVIYSNYNMKNKEFFRYIWWSALHNVASKYNIKYTGLIIGTYTNSTKEPLNRLNKVQLKDIQYFGRKLAEVNGEVGIHGYNHNSLVLEGQMNFHEYGYSPWESQKVMERGLKILKDSIENIYGDIDIYTYVPPSNIISKEGMKAVKNVFPEIKVFAGLYTGTEEKGVLYQEFGKNEHFDDVYNFPRLSSGYHYKEDLMWDIYNGIAHFGIINHFIHPDDILDEERAQGKTWKDMEKDISRIFGETYKNYPFLRPMTNIEAYKEYVNKENLKVYTKKENKEIVICYKDLVPPAYHFLRLKNDSILKIEGGEFSVLDKDTGLYLITGKKEKVKIILK